MRRRDATLDAGNFFAHAAALAARLPDRPAALNLCERRDNFLIAFAAMLIRNQTCVLPPSRVPAIVAEVMAEHPGGYKVDDALVDDAWVVHAGEQTLVPHVPADRIVVIGYTSGSTGRPRANRKTWGGFAASTALNASRLREVLPVAAEGCPPWIVATVPSQHMYGMELSVLMPLLGGMGIHSAHPLYPADIAAALAEVPAPRILVSTPVHLRALLESGVDLPDVQAVVSATAPLPAELAQAIKRRFGAVLLEFFGSTETCVIASRRTATEDAWRPYPGVTLQPVGEGTRVESLGRERVEKRVHAARAREDDPVESLWRACRLAERRRVLGRLDADRGGLDHLGTERFQVRREHGRLGPCPRNDDPPPE
jgi:acyl-coenzyme A synthetase/AMP-(fatty) acid ligase